MIDVSTSYCDVLCVGHASFDISMLVDHHPAADEKCFADSMLSCGGGPAANAAVTVARLGGRGAFAGYLGNDVYGNQHLQELIEHGVDTGMVVRGTAPTPVSVIMVKPSGDRTVVNYKADTPVISAGGVSFDRCSPQVVLFDGHEPKISMEIVEWARKKGIPTVLDAGSVHQGTRELSSVVDYLVASAKFALDSTGEQDAEACLKRLSEVSSNSVVVTLGSGGLIWSREGKIGRLPSFPVKAVDTTGAGDIFHGAFALGLSRGMQWEALLEFASAAAALSCTQVGARPSIPTEGQVEEFLSQMKLLISVCHEYTGES